jgi:hypothetical protein
MHYGLRPHHAPTAEQDKGRSRLWNQLGGIYPKTPPAKASAGSASHRNDVCSVLALKEARRIVTPLRLPDTHSATRGRIRFAETVTVVEIPDRHCYADDKDAIWNSCREIREMARRNRIEFAFEGHDIDNVVDDADFLVRNGFHVHPAHAASE